MGYGSKLEKKMSPPNVLVLAGCDRPDLESALSEDHGYVLVDERAACCAAAAGARALVRLGPGSAPTALAGLRAEARALGVELVVCWSIGPDAAPHGGAGLFDANRIVLPGSDARAEAARIARSGEAKRAADGPGEAHKRRRI